MKKIMNHANNMVTEMCHGLVLAHPELEFLEPYKIITSRDKKRDKVSLISGGGSGHEPAHAGFVGKGMLDAVVCGDIFASPSQIQVYEAIKATQSTMGTLLIIKNYSGDIMNFKNAAQMAKNEGIAVEYVKIEDDIAVQDSLYTVGRRGVAGTVFVHKIAGAAAARGDDLSRIKELAKQAAANVRSIGFALTSCTVPAKGSPTFKLGDDEMEYGVGIHGEPGIQKEGILSADELAQRMVEALLKDLNISRNSQTEIAVLVNGLGGSPLQELYVLNHSIQKTLHTMGIKVVFTLVGNYMTSIDMAGASISILKLDNTLKELLFDPCDTVALKISKRPIYRPYYDLTEQANKNYQLYDRLQTDSAYAQLSTDTISLQNIIYIVDAMSVCIVQNEQLFCQLDAHAGDGDFGTSIAKGFRVLKENLETISGNEVTIGGFLGACSLIITEQCGGASGPIWGSAFQGAAIYTDERTVLSKIEFAQMLQQMVEAIQTTGERSFGRGAIEGDKTLIDALVPCADTWSELAQSDMTVKEMFHKGAQAAVIGAESTKHIAARMGRAAVLGDRSIGYPDAGAHALGIIFSEIAKQLEDR